MLDNTTLFRLIGAISRQSTSAVNQQVRPLGLANNLFIYLMRIVEHQHLTQVELVHLTRIDKTTLSRALTQLEQRGYIQRTVDPDNHKYKRVIPTGKAINVYPQLHALEQAYVQRALGTLSPVDQQRLGTILTHVDNQLQ